MAVAQFLSQLQQPARSYSLTNRGLLTEIFHLLWMQFQNTLFEQIIFIAAMGCIWKTQGSVYKPPNKKHDNSQTMSGTISPPTDNYVHLCM